MAETAYVISVYNGGYKKIKEIAKKVLTSGGRSGILSKLFGTTGCEPQKTSKKRRKKWLTNEERPDIIAMFRRERRAPCKLNNVTKRKHQTDASFVRDHGRRTKEAEGPG
jgi:hypothetical protein